MSFSLLLKDELKNFYRSKVMLFLWVGLPTLTIILRLLEPNTGDLPQTTLSAIVVSSLGGTLASVMLAVSIVNEREKKIYNLFLIRPIKRRDLIFSKFFSVYICIAVASTIALTTGFFIDFFQTGLLSQKILENSIKSLATSLSMMAISSSAGVLIGILSPSILLGAILVIYGANQISIIPTLPIMFNTSNQLAFAILTGATLSTTLLAVSIFLFNRKQL